MTDATELNAETARELAAGYTIEQLDNLIRTLPYAKVETMNVWLVPDDGYVHIHVSHMAMVNLIKRYPLVLRQLREALARIEALERDRAREKSTP